MSKVLVTGGSGFIGRNLVEQLAGRYDVAAPSSSELDLLDEGSVRRYLHTNRFDVVVHCATTRCNRRVPAPPDLLDRNCRMFFNLARNESAFGKMIYFGSGAEYERRCLPSRVKESYFDTRVPSDAYGFSKYICAKFAERSQNIVDLRLFGVFGKYEAWDVRFISNTCGRVIHGLPIVIRQNVVFDYLYIDDLARIASWFIDHNPRRKAYNVCSGRSYELTTLAAMIAEVSGTNPPILIKNEGMSPEYTADNSLLLEEIGGYRFKEMGECIRELYAWYSAHRDAIDATELRFDG